VTADDAAIADDAVRNEGAPSRLTAWLPMAIVVASVLAAIMGWRASVADEHSNRHYELSRQELVRQQQLRLGDIQQVNGQAREFGSYERYSLLAQSLRKESRAVGGSAGAQLAREADSNLNLAASILSRVDSAIPYTAQDGITLNPAYPYRINEARRAAALDNTELQALDPDRLRKQAEHVRLQGEYLTGLAALFVAAIVLFTLAAVSRGRPVRSFGLSGVLVAVVGIVLFIVVEAS
jgi:hypothetical protein